MSLLTQSEVYEEVTRAQAENRKIAVATIVTTSGSTPQRTGAKLLVFEDGRMMGTVGGGCVEADVWAEAREALAEDKPRLCKFSLRDNPDAPPEYFAVSADGGVDGLSSTLEKITSGLITSCRLQLDHDAPLGEPTFVWVDGEMITQDDPNGWHYDKGTSPDTVVLDGATCEKAETDGLAGVRITFDCPEKPH